MAPQPQANSNPTIKGPIELDATSLTFAGMVPTDNPLPSGELSLEEPAPEQEKLSIVDRGERPAVLGEANDQRTAKVQFALGEKAPSPEVTSNALASGNEAALRTQVAAQKDADDQAAKMDVIKQAAANGSLDTWNPKTVEAVVRSTPKNDPATIFEKAFAKAYVGLVPQLGNPEESVVNRAVASGHVSHVADMADIAEVLITKQEIAKSAAEDFEAAAKEQSWGGWAVDKAKSFASFGMYDWYKTYNAVTPVDGTLKGSNWAEQIQYLYTLAPSDMHKALRNTLDTISVDNPSLASEFADAVVSFSSTQQFLTNVGNVVDVASIVPVGRAVKSGKAIVAAITGGSEKELTKEGATVAYQAAVAANATAKTDIGSAMASMGALSLAIVVNAVKRLPEILGGQEVPLAPAQVQQRLASLYNPASIGGDSSFSAAATQRLVEKLAANADEVQSRIRDLEKVTRLPGEAEKIAIEETKQRLANRFAHPNNTVVDVGYELRLTKVGERLAEDLAERREAYKTAVKIHEEASAASKAEPTNITLRDRSKAAFETAALIKAELAVVEKKAAKNEAIRTEIELRRTTHTPAGFEITQAEDHNSNVTHVSMLLGNRTGEGFDDQIPAWRWAKSVLKLNDDDINIEQRGVKYFIKVTRPIDETTPAVRQALTIDTNAQTPTGLAHSFFGWLAGNGRLSQEQIENRIVAASGSSALVTMMKEIAQPIGSLSKGEYKRLIRVMEDNRAMIDPITDKPGAFHNTIADLDRAYQRMFGQAVSEKEATAYFSAVQLNDIDYTMRNLALYKERARQGVETFRLLDMVDKGGGKTYANHSGQFLAKELDSLPIDAAKKHPATVAIHRYGKEPEVVDLASLDTVERRAYIADLQKDGYKIIQTHNPSRTVLDKFGPDNINFIITKDFERKALDPVQLPYRPGWHQEYDQQWYTKQAQIKRVEKGPADNPSAMVRHYYEGETTAMAHTTEAEAKLWSSKYEEARQIMNGEKPGSLGDYLRKEMPMFTEREFRSKFEATAEREAIFHKDVPFTHTFTGNQPIDMPGHRDVLSKKFENLYDDIRSPWNLMANENKKFVGQRDATLDTVKNVGTQSNPVFQLADASMIDPISSLSRGMHDVMRNRFMVDYKHSAVEQWMNEFGHLLTSPSSVEDMWGNAVTHLHQGNFVKSDPANFNQLMAAKQSRLALLEFLGTESPDKMAFNKLRQEAANIIYKNAPPNIADYINLRLLASTNDPVRVMQGFAFHTSFFMNPFQGLQNAMVMANALALGGLKSGLPGFRAGWGMQMLRYNASEAGLEAVAKVSGWDKKWVKEAWDGIQSTGRLFVEGEHAWKDDLADPKFFQGVFGNVLDKGQVFFREGERIGRMTAWATAYHEWRIANPEAVFDAAARAKVLARSDDMTVNMTRASKATWQQGILSIPTQFWAWNARNMELMVGRWGNGLSVADRAKLIGVNSLLYGVPLGAVAPAVGGFLNPWEPMREHFVNKGWDVNDKTFDALYSGLTGMAYHLATGEPGNVNERLGLGGSNIVKDAFDDHKSLAKWLFGVSGSRTADALTSAKPFGRALYYALSGDSEKFRLTSSDFLDLARNVKIADTGVKTYMALNTGKYITKNGLYQGDVTPTEAVLNAFTDGLPRRLTDPKAMQDVTKSRQDSIKQGSKELQKNVTAAMVAAVNGDESMHNVYMRRAATLAEAMDLRPDERASLWAKLMDEVNPQAAKVPYEFWAKNAPPSVATDRYNAWTKSRSQPPMETK